ncbi:MAG: hypothetical protein LBC51_08240 [Treponema sp.]|nr:hypothetical protein [Treponema sp.]
MGKKKPGLEGLKGKIRGLQVQVDKQGGEETDISGAAFSYVYGEEYQRRHLKRIEKKRETEIRFSRRWRKGTGQAVKSNITDKESAKVKGAHGYIQGYNGIAIADRANQVIVAAESFGSGTGRKSRLRMR